MAPRIVKHDFDMFYKLDHGTSDKPFIYDFANGVVHIGPRTAYHMDLYDAIARSEHGGSFPWRSQPVLVDGKPRPWADDTHTIQGRIDRWTGNVDMRPDINPRLQHLVDAVKAIKAAGEWHNDDQPTEGFKLGSIGPKFMDHDLTQPTPMGVATPLTKFFDDSSWSERIPLVYHKDTDTIHVGNKDYAHNDLLRAMRAANPGVTYGYRNTIQGWVGHNPEMHRAQEGWGPNYGWYQTPPGHVDDAVRERFQINPDDEDQQAAEHFRLGSTINDVRADTDFKLGNDRYVRNASEEPPRIVHVQHKPYENEDAWKGRQVFIWRPSMNTVWIGAPGAHHGHITERPDYPKIEYREVPADPDDPSKGHFYRSIEEPPIQGWVDDGYNFSPGLSSWSRKEGDLTGRSAVPPHVVEAIRPHLIPKLQALLPKPDAFKLGMLHEANKFNKVRNLLRKNNIASPENMAAVDVFEHKFPKHEHLAEWLHREFRKKRLTLSGHSVDLEDLILQAQDVRKFEGEVKALVEAIQNNEVPDDQREVVESVLAKNRKLVETERKFLDKLHNRIEVEVPVKIPGTDLIMEPLRFTEESLNLLDKVRKAKGIDLLAKDNTAHAMHQMVQDHIAEEKAKDPNGELIHSFPDGWTIKRLRDQADCDYEHEQLGHCIDSYGHQCESGESINFSLRDPLNRSKATWEYTPKRNNSGGLDGVLNNKDGLHPLQEAGFTLEEMAEIGHRYARLVSDGKQGPGDDPVRLGHSVLAILANKYSQYGHHWIKGEGNFGQEIAALNEDDHRKIKAWAEEHDRKQGKPWHGQRIVQCQGSAIGRGDRTVKDEYKKRIFDYHQSLPEEWQPKVANHDRWVVDLKSLGGHHHYTDIGEHIPGGKKYAWQDLIQQLGSVHFGHTTHDKQLQQEYTEMLKRGVMNAAATDPNQHKFFAQSLTESFLEDGFNPADPQLGHTMGEPDPWSYGCKHLYDWHNEVAPHVWNEPGFRPGQWSRPQG